MDIKLVQRVPSKDGYYLVKFHETGGLHLVLVQTQIDGERIIIPDVCPLKSFNDKKTLNCLCEAKRLYFREFPTTFFWSEEPINGE